MHDALTAFIAIGLLGLPFLIVAARRFDARRATLGKTQLSLLSLARQFLFVGSLGWVLCVVVLYAAVQRSPGVGMSELALVGIPTGLMLAGAALSLLALWVIDYSKRRDSRG